MRCAPRAKRWQGAAADRHDMLLARKSTADCGRAIHRARATDDAGCAANARIFRLLLRGRRQSRSETDWPICCLVRCRPPLRDCLPCACSEPCTIHPPIDRARISLGCGGTRPAPGGRPQKAPSGTGATRRTQAAEHGEDPPFRDGRRPAYNRAHSEGGNGVHAASRYNSASSAKVHCRWTPAVDIQGTSSGLHAAVRRPITSSR